MIVCHVIVYCTKVCVLYHINYFRWDQSNLAEKTSEMGPIPSGNVHCITELFQTGSIPSEKQLILNPIRTTSCLD